MNILHLLSGFDSYDAIATTLDLSQHLIKNDYNCIIASSIEPQFLKINSSDIKYNHLPLFERNIKDYFTVYKKLKNIIRTYNIDIVHTHSNLSTWFAFLPCRHTERPLVTTCYEFCSKNIFSQALILAKKIIIHHQAVGKHLFNNFGLNIERIKFIRPSIDLKNFNFCGVDDRSKTDFNIGIIPSLFPNRGYEYFLKAMVRVVRIMPYIKIQILTFTNQTKQDVKEDLRLWVRKLGLTNYVNFSEVSNLDSNILSELNLLIATPIKESAYTRLLLEAQAYGVPVIATQVAGLAEVISTNKTGILISPKDNNALATAIIKILKDIQFSREITISGRKKIEEEFNLEKNIGDFIKAYKEAKNNVKILIINIGKIQDVIASIPAVRLIRKNFSQAQIISLITPSLRCLLQHCPYIDELVVYDCAFKHKGFLGFMKILKILIKNKFDIVFDFSDSFKSYLLSYLSLADKRYGYSNRIFKFLINYGVKRSAKSLSLVNEKLSILTPLGLDIKDCRLELWPSEDDVVFADNLFNDSWIGKEKVIGIDVSFKRKFINGFKTLDCLAYLCDKLANQNRRVILVSSSDNFNLKDELSKKIRFKPILAVGAISLIQLASIIKKCDIYISTNPESAYIAMAMKIPSIILSLERNSFDFSAYKNIEILTAKEFHFDLKKKPKRDRLGQAKYTDTVMGKINRLIQEK